MKLLLLWLCTVDQSAVGCTIAMGIMVDNGTSPMGWLVVVNHNSLATVHIITLDSTIISVLQFWDIVLRECARLGRSQRISVIYPVLCRLKKQLSVEVNLMSTLRYIQE